MLAQILRAFRKNNFYLILTFFTICFLIHLSLSFYSDTIRTLTGHSRNKSIFNSFFSHPKERFGSLPTRFLFEPRDNFDCSTAVGHSLRSGILNQKLSFLDKQYNWKELWLSQTSASFMVRTGKKYSVEKGRIRRVIEYKDLNMTLKNLHPEARKHFSSRIGCKKCFVVGSGSCLRGKNLGSFIDSFPVVIRMNKPPLENFETTVGSKTDIRFLYPESSPSEKTFFKGEGFVAVVPYKRDDYLWAATMANQSLKLHLSDFWSREPPPKYLPVESKKILIVNPNITESIFKHLNARATIGFISIVIALNFCESVSIAGFCYKSANENAFTYYYGTEKLRNDLSKRQNHVYHAETQMIQEMKKLKLITDLTDSPV